MLVLFDANCGCLLGTEDQHKSVGRVDGCDARRRDRVRVRPPSEHDAAVQRARERPQPEDHASLL